MANRPILPKACWSGRLSRREILRAGGLGAVGLSLADLLAAEQAGTQGDASMKARADRCIIIFLNGGPSHLDMWDMKPDAPKETRGEFKPIATSTPGVQFCEHLPRLARWMNRAALVRSMHHSVNNAHALAVYTAMTGHDRGDASRIVGASADDHPTPGAMLARFRPAADGAVPHVALPYKTKEGAGGPPQPGFFGGWLGPGHDPLWVLKDPGAADFSVPELTLPMDVSSDRLAARGELLARLGAEMNHRGDGGRLAAMDDFRRQAAGLLTSPAVQRAFRIQQEPEGLRDSYGRNIYGQSVLLARRLIEAGTRLVTISWAPDANATWDTHGGNFKKLKGSLLPQLDAAAAALLEDLHGRGMLERTLVAVLGDFGRTPKINNNEGGRDHWNWCYSVMLAGGGVRGGFVLGASDRIGAYPADRPTTPGDLMATMYHLLGIDPHRSLADRLGRPHRIVPDGDVVAELVS